MAEARPPTNPLNKSSKSISILIIIFQRPILTQRNNKTSNDYHCEVKFGQGFITIQIYIDKI